ncbi:SNF2 domain-containing protein CLASSY 3-like [Phalaenopsis equestris]|uniref:SNF2 domain-containing protein CLASSY 3-like n=1 Tax=Phalaenopsis equestris TaxID=78828 RepID=UPI0009E46916|nr:SNF2 domain-containing protein CLASSY 3-like [Phalaenopsis equestris]
MACVAQRTRSRKSRPDYNPIIRKPPAIPSSAVDIPSSPSGSASVIALDDFDDENLEEVNSKHVISFKDSFNCDLASTNYCATAAPDNRAYTTNRATSEPSHFDLKSRASCVAKRTRLQIGFLSRFSYTRFYEDKVSDDDEEQVVGFSNSETGYEIENEKDDAMDTLPKRPVNGKLEKFNWVEILDLPGREIIAGLSSSDVSEENERGFGSLNKFNSAKKARIASKRVIANPSKDNKFLKYLLDSIFVQAEEVCRDENRDVELVEDYPLLFSFKEEDTKLTWKSPCKDMSDELWTEFDFALQSVNVGDYGNDELPEDHLCSKGEHEFVLDDQIGIICKFCSFVRDKINFILPSLAKHGAESKSNKNFAIKFNSWNFNNMFIDQRNDSNINDSDLLTGTVWDHIPGVSKTLYEHQKEAFEFIWKNLAGSIHLHELKPHPGSSHLGGCVISHAPGTGKTRLTIVFIQSFLQQFPQCRPLIIAPRGMLLTWENEFKKWKVNLAFHNLNLKDYYQNEADSMIKSSKKEWIRLLKLCSWQRNGGVLAISYTLFAKLTTGGYANSSEGATVSTALLKKPGLIIFDEGHTPRNDLSLIWQAIERVETKNRIILSGTPFQNNLRELSNTLCLVRPNLGNILSNIVNPLRMKDADIFRGRNRGKIKLKYWSKNSNFVDSSKIAKLKAAIKPFVHVHNGNILATLPGLQECLILLNPHKNQKNIIEKLDRKSSFDVEVEYKLCMASIHPSLMTSVKLSEQERSVIDVNLLQKWKLNPNFGVKTKFVIELVRLSQALNEKVLVFCQYVEPLMLLRDQLIKTFDWTDGKHILKMDGSVPSKSRQSLMDFFNDLGSEARILLASTKACSEGISLVGASRVVLLNVLWNPSVERQALSRAYRIGQLRVVYTYQLIMSGCGEREKYSKQVQKDKLSELLFSVEYVSDKIAHNSCKVDKERTSKLISEDKILEGMTANVELKDMFINLYFPVKKSAAMGAFKEDGVDAS